MKELVINRCHGGFGLSHEAVMRYAELKGITLYFEEEYSVIHYYTVPVNEYRKIYEEAQSKQSWKDVNELYFSESDIERDDPLLIQVVRELGEKASGRHSKLKIVQIPDDVNYEIDEYDGIEHVSEVHRTWS